MSAGREEALGAQRPRRVLQLHGTFETGGKEARLVRLMNRWAGQLHHDILLGDISRDGAKAGLDPAVQVRFLDVPALGGPPVPGKLHQLASFMQDYDLVLSFNWGAMDGVMAHRLFSPFMKLPPLIHHEDGFNADEAAGRMPRRNRYRRWALRRSHALVVPSGVLAHIAVEEWGQRADHVHQFPNGIDVEAYAGPRPGTAIPGFVPDGRLIVGTLAGLRPVKNLRRLVRAVAPLKDRLRLVIVGEGPERELIAQEAHALGMDDVAMPGFLPRPQDYIGAFDIFALSSDSEQFPISLVEAMAAGLPVVSTDVGDVMSMVAYDNRPYIVGAEDAPGFTGALATLVGDAALRAHLGQSNQTRAVQCFDEQVMFGLYAGLYGKALGATDLLS